MDILRNQNNYASLSLRDLLDARDQYHLHLLNKQNVVGTAVGLYLIRKSDPWPDKENPTQKRSGKPKGERTFGNSETRPYSWPCIVVMVKEWVAEDKFTGSVGAQDIVPRTLYLPDGRMVPVCVVKVEQADAKQDELAPWLWPEGAIGGGFPLLVRNQGIERVASVGCLVTDGHSVYALTNRHVCGAPGQQVSARLRGDVVTVGQSVGMQLTRLPFTDVYPSFPGKRTYLNLDVGLVEVDDARDWTSSIYGLGAVGPLADLNEQNLGLQLIDCPVSAFGAVSGHLTGNIKALFYRYKSVGGYDYVSDLLIAPAANSNQTRPGDSGTVWHLKSEVAGADKKMTTVYRPLALEWGGQTFGIEGEKFNFALATNLSNVCKLLDVELVSELNREARPYWGATGHYSIGGAAISQIADSKLRKLMTANAARISYDRSELEAGKIGEVLREAAFVPLADVADVIWKKTPWNVTGGRDPAANKGPEHPVHYADIDIVGPDGKTLRELCMKDPTANMTVEFWQGFYDSMDMKGSSSRGLLPFRVWQFYDAMVDAASSGDYLSFMTAGGLMAHYVGDACQTLHGSVLADGYKDEAEEVLNSKGNPKKVWPGQGIHSAFETKMIDVKAKELFAEIGELLKKPKDDVAPVTSGQEAATAILTLMDQVAKILPPKQLCDAYIQLGQGQSRPVIDGLWKKFGGKTAKCMALGIRCLAHIWDGAWEQGGGKQAKAADLKEFSEDEVRALYEDTAFVPSLDLDHIGDVLK